jgi:hypothetical protein
LIEYNFLEIPEKNEEVNPKETFPTTRIGWYYAGVKLESLSFGAA